MRRVSREALRMRLVVAMATLKPHQKTRSGLTNDAIREEIADAMIQRIMGSPASEAVILEPDLIGSPHSPSKGRWDIDEPHPHPDVPFSRH